MLTSFDPIIDYRAQILILGTMSGEESLAAGQYYAHPKNQFWKIMFSILNVSEPDNYEEKVRIIQDHGLARLLSVDFV